MGQTTLSVTDSLKTKRDELSSKRNLLFKDYCRNPQALALASEIKAIDDQIAELTAQMREETVAGRKSKPAPQNPSRN